MNIKYLFLLHFNLSNFCVSLFLSHFSMSHPITFLSFVCHSFVSHYFLSLPSLPATPGISADPSVTERKTFQFLQAWHFTVMFSNILVANIKPIRQRLLYQNRIVVISIVQL